MTHLEAEVFIGDLRRIVTQLQVIGIPTLTKPLIHLSV